MNKLTICATALAVLLIVGCGKGPAPEAPSAETTRGAKGDAGVRLSADAAKTAEVRVEAVSRRTLRGAVESPGTVALPWDSHAVVSPPVAGKVIRLYAKVGDSVRKGQPLVEIQSADLAQAGSSVAATETQALQAAATVRQEVSEVELAKGRLRTAQATLQRQRRFAQSGAFSQPTLSAARNALSEAQTEDAGAKSGLAGAQSRFDRAERLSKEGLVSKADYDQAKLDVQQAHIRVERAQKRLELAQQTFDRESSIGQQGLQNAREIQTAEAELRAAQLEVERAEVGLQGAKSALTGAQRAVMNARSNVVALRGGGVGGASSVTLTAPITGTVVEREATLGQAVERSTKLFDIDDDSTMWVTASVPEGEVARIVPGAVVSVTTNAHPGKRFSGTVQILGERLDPKTRTLPVQCRIPNAQGLLRVGLTARVRISAGGTVTALAVPANAIVGEGDDLSVFVEKDGAYLQRKVNTGRKDAGLVEIVEGLQEGERIAVSGAFTLLSEAKASEEGK